MSKKEEILGDSTSLNEEGSVTTYDLNDQEKSELQALAALVQQARLAQDIIYTRLLQSIAVRNEVKDSTLELDMEKVFKDGVEGIQLVTTKQPQEEQDESQEDSKES